MSVAIFQTFNPELGCIYLSADEAVKELVRTHEEGIQFTFIQTPDFNEYWIVGVRRYQNPKTLQVLPADVRQTAIYDNTTEADQHAQRLKDSGVPTAQIVCSKMKVNTTGPKVESTKVDSSEMMALDAKLEALLARFQFGGLKTTGRESMGVKLEWTPPTDEYVGTWGISYDEKRFKILDTSAAPWNQLFDPTQLVDAIVKATILFEAVGKVDPKTQPNKWNNIRSQCHEFVQSMILYGLDEEKLARDLDGETPPDGAEG